MRAIVILAPPLPYHIRPMLLSDVDAVMAIERHSFPSAWSEAGYRHELTANQQAHYVVLEVADKDSGRTLIGYAGHWIVAGEAHVSTIAVASAWRRRGLGAWLLLSIIFHALDCDAGVVSLEVREENHIAQALYARYGFVSVGRRRRYYRDTGEDAILMDLDLQAQGTREMLHSRRAELWQRLQAEGA